MGAPERAKIPFSDHHTQPSIRCQSIEWCEVSRSGCATITFTPVLDAKSSSLWFEVNCATHFTPTRVLYANIEYTLHSGTWCQHWVLVWSVDPSHPKSWSKNPRLSRQVAVFLSRLNFNNDIFLCGFWRNVSSSCADLDQRHINSGDMAPKKRTSSGGENQRVKLPKVCPGDENTEYIATLSEWCLGLSWTSGHVGVVKHVFLWFLCVGPTSGFFLDCWLH